jgi:hypothetical protein
VAVMVISVFKPVDCNIESIQWFVSHLFYCPQIFEIGCRKKIVILLNVFGSNQRELGGH